MMIPQSWPDWTNEIWAKSAEKGAGGQPETLAQHTWNVLEKLAETIRLRPDLPQLVKFPGLWNCLFWACYLHDFGKAAKGFQERSRGGERWPHRHEVLSTAFLEWISEALSTEEQQWTAGAILAHHRDAEDILLAYSERGDPNNEHLARRTAELEVEPVRKLWHWLAECSGEWISALGLTNVGITFPTFADEQSAVQAICVGGAANIRKRLNTYRRWVRTIEQSEKTSLSLGTIALRGHIISSDHMASAHTGDLPKPELDGPEKLLQRWELSADLLYEHQRQSLMTKGSAVLMAPTGSGKTESALLWAAAQARGENPLPRLYYTLPYQASMNAMFDRLNSQKDGAFPGQVGLEHGRSTLAYYHRLLEEEGSRPENASQQARWLKNLAKLSYYPVRVLSPYQILKGPYRLKGYETLLSDYFEAAFILDEVHAYEAQRLALILGTVKMLRELYGANFFVMSATLPSLLVEKLSEALGSYLVIKATPELYKKFQRHLLFLRKGELLDKEALEQIAGSARRGQSVLVCCNTVGRAQAAYGALKDLLPGAQITLLHGRFNGQDRLGKESLVRDAAGSRSKQERRAMVLVATQVVEVSLDIDLDVIYTDPAPLEALLQRFGRINRRRLREWAPVNVFREPIPEQKRPYDPNLIQAGLVVLEENDGRMIDEASVSEWLDRVYQGQIAADWEQEYQFAYKGFCEGVLANLRAFSSDAGLEELFYRAFDSVEVLPMALSETYWARRDENPIEASQLLVPLRWGQYHALLSKGRVRADDKGRVKEVDAYYDEEYGLDLNRKYNESFSTYNEPI